ncbi:MAG: XTP/dITP diphosphatase [Candidatus Methanomethylicus sp.]|nr:XTP/dITP diphosphatase [Candidatus Methanomethylicus sp.]
MKPILFVTGNQHKCEEASRALAEYGITLKMANCEKVEIQSDSLGEIALYAANWAAMKLGTAVLVEDSGLFIKSLGGFPGPFSSYAHKTIGCGGILSLMSGESDRKAFFEAAVAYVAPNAKPQIFTGLIDGEIARSVRGSQGFGFDPIFEPDGYGGKTFAEISLLEKTSLSHRGKAFRCFGKWYSECLKSTTLK